MHPFQLAVGCLPGQIDNKPSTTRAHVIVLVLEERGNKFQQLRLRSQFIALLGMASGNMHEDEAD